MQYLSWLLSFIFHAILFFALIQTIHLAPLDLHDVMEVDLTEMETPQEIAPLPIPIKHPEPEPPAPEPEPEPMGDVAPLPLPQNKTIVLDDSPPPPEPVVEEAPAPLPEPEPEVMEISPVKTPVEEAPEKPKKIIVRKNDTIVHRGHEARFGRSMMGDYYSYSAAEFSGQFTTKDNRTISIIDARNTKYGRFLIYDSKNKTLRRMKQFGKYVYTIGPSIYEDEPVIGSVTFLAKNDRIERFILQTDDDRLAHYPKKVHVREEEVQFPTNNGLATGYITMPPHGKGYSGVVFTYGNQCTDPGLVRGFTRALAAHNLASITFLPQGCEDEAVSTASDEMITSEVRAALTHFASLSQVDKHKIGLWGDGAGITTAIDAMAEAARKPAYIICAITDQTRMESLPNSEDIARLSVPTLWLVTGRETARWTGFVATLEQIRDTQNKPMTIVVAPLKGSKDVDDAKGAASNWVESVTEDHAQLVLSWIHGIGK